MFFQTHDYSMHIRRLRKGGRREGRSAGPPPPRSLGRSRGLEARPPDPPQEASRVKHILQDMCDLGRPPPSAASPPPSHRGAGFGGVESPTRDPPLTPAGTSMTMATISSAYVPSPIGRSPVSCLLRGTPPASTTRAIFKNITLSTKIPRMGGTDWGYFFCSRALSSHLRLSAHPPPLRGRH